MRAVQMDGRAFTVERFENTTAPRAVDRIQYRLTGTRGASYTTMRNAKHPGALFVLVGGGRSPRTCWFTDARGELEPVDGMGAALAIIAQAKPVAVATPAPAPPAIIAQAAADVKRLEKLLEKAQKDSLAWAKRRGAMEPGTSRARVTTANAKWARAAEHRDRISDLLDAARVRLQAALTTEGAPQP